MRSCKRSLQWNCGAQPPSLTRDRWRRCLPIFILLLIFGMLIRYTNPTAFLFEGFHGAMCKWKILNPVVLLLQDFCGTVRGIAKFLEKPLSESQLRQLEQHCSFDNMRNNDSVNYSWNRGIWSDGEFLRKGWNTLRRNFCHWVCLGQHKLNPLFAWHPPFNFFWWNPHKQLVGERGGEWGKHEWRVTSQKFLWQLSLAPTRKQCRLSPESDA